MPRQDKKFSEWVSSLETATNEELAVGFIPVDVGNDSKKTRPISDKTQLGLGNVNNTSDADKPISIATQTALSNVTQLIGMVGEWHHITTNTEVRDGESYVIIDDITIEPDTQFSINANARVKII
jgi:hypothetical protein